NTFSPKTTGKLGVRWKPIEDLLVRTTYSQAFRAPAITDLFLGATDSFPTLTDPCTGPAPGANRPQGTDVDANCDAEGVPDNAPQFSSQILTRFGGNTELQPETADTLTAGLVWSPEMVRDFNVYVDYFSVKLEEFINFLDPQFILTDCYQRPAGSPRPKTCDFVARNADGSISFVSAKSFNFSRLDTAGIDVAFDYVLPIADWFPGMEQYGVWKVVYDSQYLLKYNRFSPVAGGGEEEDGIISTDKGFAGDNVGGDSPLPRYKANFTIEWALSNWKASWSTRFIGKVTEPCDDGISPSLQSYGVCSNPDPNTADGIDDSTNEMKETWYHNIQGIYALPEWNTEFTLGVNNLLDQDPPISQSAFADSMARTLYEPWGSRQPYLRFKINF
ncbi:MAG: TonB-dependent receptor domain-containing protein, partial [Microthrixaceae bacterium]